MKLGKALKTRIENFASPKLLPGGVHVGEWVTSKTPRSETYCTIIDRGTSRDRESGAMYWDEVGLSIVSFAETKQKVRRLAGIIEAVLDETDNFETNEGGVVDVRSRPATFRQEDDDTWRADLDLIVMLEKLNIKALGALHFHCAPEGLVYDADGDPFVDWYDLGGSGGTASGSGGSPTIDDTARNDLAGVQLALGDQITSPLVTTAQNNFTLALVHSIGTIASGTPSVFSSQGASASSTVDATSTSEDHTITITNDIFESRSVSLSHGAGNFGILIVESADDELRGWIKVGGSEASDSDSGSYTPFPTYSAFELGSANFNGTVCEMALFSEILGSMALANLKTHLQSKYDL